jgi:hypothetical protein
MPMFAPVIKNLRVKLQERKDAVLRANADHFESHLSTFLNFIKAQTYLASISDELRRKIKPEELSKLREELNTDKYQPIILPSDEAERAALIHILLEYLAEQKEQYDLLPKVYGLLRISDTEKGISEIKDQLFLPFYHYYDERLDDSDLLLYLLIKYKRLVEWFRREELFQKISSGSGQRERILDDDLREFLVKEGIDYPFSTPHSPQGRADIVIPDEDKPVPMEIKLFDNNQYRKDYVRKGLNQALKYAEDYSQPVAYLVIFNLSDKTLQIESSNTNSLFPTIDAHNKTIFVVTINIVPVTLTASEQKKPEAIVLDVEYLLTKVDDK